MYKLLIADDEKEIREGLAAWTWEAAGIELAGTCAHGLEALQFIEEQPVDVVLTDIRMPFMDGMELMDVLAKRYPFIRVMILSGYSDFEYAKKGLQNGAVDYLLKPLQFQQLRKATVRLVEKLNQEKQAEMRVAVLKRKTEMLTHVLRNQFLRRLFCESLRAEAIEQGSAEGEIILEGSRFTAAVIRPDRFVERHDQLSDRERKLITFSLDNILSDSWETGELGYHWVDEATGEAYLLCTKDDAAEIIKQLLRQWTKYRGLFRSTFSAGIGQTVERCTDIHRSAWNARQALRRKERPSSIMRYDERLDPALPSIVSMTERRLNEWDVASADSEHLVLEQAKTFIGQNYHRSITLDEVAGHVHMSTSHLFALFKQSGETYLKFLTSVRLRRAVELLTTTNLKIYEIVEKIGYSDPAYFTEVFKKNVGRTPNAFRSELKS